MNPFILSCFFTAFSTIILGSFIFLQNPKDRVNRAWFFTTLAIFIWTLGLGAIGLSEDKTQALFWQRILYIGTIFIPIFFFHFSVAFLEKNKRARVAVIIGYALSLFFVFLLFTKLFIVGIAERTSFNYWPVETGPLYWLFLVYFIFYVSCAIILLKIDREKYEDIKQKQLDYMYYAALIGVIGGSTNFLLDFFPNLYPFGNYFVILYVVFITYAILKHHLFSLKIIATELLTFSLWIFLFMRTLLAETMRDRLIDGSLLALVIFFGVLLIRSVLQEVQQREEISHLAEDLRKANIELKKLDQMKSEFVSLASHQLRTPLTVIKGYISLMQEGTFGQIPDKLSDALRKIYVSNETLINLVGDFLNLSRIESGKMKYMFEPMQEEEMIQSVYEEFKEVVKEKKIELRYEKPAGPFAKATLDKDKFRQVIMNLVDNAIKYTPEGSVTLKLEEEKKDGATNILFSVSDSGVGMSKEDLNGIFKRFSRAEGANKVNVSGLGLGLYLAKRIVTDHGGEIWASSDGPGKGSTFWVRVPARAEQIKKEDEIKSN